MLDVAAWLYWGQAHGRGRLIIDDDGVIRVVPSRRSRIVLPPGTEHSAGAVTVYRSARRVGVLVEPDEDGNWLAVTSLHRAAVLDALKRSGPIVSARGSVATAVRALRLGRT